MAGEKTLLQITQCSVASSGTVSAGGKVFTAMINPAGYSQDYCIKYTRSKTMGLAGSEAKFDRTLPETLQLKELVFDGTGIVSSVAVTDQIANLRSVAYEYDGSEHQPPVVQLVWGTLTFTGRITSIKCDYTLFKPSGEPLRAKVTIAMVEYSSPSAIAKESGKSSPDLTHLVEVKAGDTLPLLCYRIYRDCGYYLQVARFNGLHDFRQLKPGTRLIFPPLA